MKSNFGSFVTHSCCSFSLAFSYGCFYALKGSTACLACQSWGDLAPKLTSLYILDILDLHQHTYYPAFIAALTEADTKNTIFNECLLTLFIVYIYMEAVVFMGHPHPRGPSASALSVFMP